MVVWWVVVVNRVALIPPRLVRLLPSAVYTVSGSRVRSAIFPPSAERWRRPIRVHVTTSVRKPSEGARGDHVLQLRVHGNEKQTSSSWRRDSERGVPDWLYASAVLVGSGTCVQSGLSGGACHTSTSEQSRGSWCGVSGRRRNTCCSVCWQVWMTSWLDENRLSVVAWGGMKTSTRKLADACKMTGVVRH